MTESSLADYRHYADHCVAIAREVSNTGNKAMFLVMARFWLALADEVVEAREPHG